MEVTLLPAAHPRDLRCRLEVAGAEGDVFQALVTALRVWYSVWAAPDSVEPVSFRSEVVLCRDGEREVVRWRADLGYAGVPALHDMVAAVERVCAELRARKAALALGAA